MIVSQTDPATSATIFSDRSMVTGIVLEILEPARTALLVVDVQNDYCSPSGALGEAGLSMTSIDPMVDRVEELIATARELEIPIVFFRNEHSEETDTPAWRRRTSHSLSVCKAGTWGADFYRLRPSDRDTEIVKHRYSGFVGTPLEELLHEWGRNTVVIVGTATNVCVDTTARHAAILDFDVVVVSDGVAATDSAAHTASLDNLERFFGHVIPTSDVRDVWLAGRTQRPNEPLA
jgi:ureidoacrylate peracid hydrolase